MTQRISARISDATYKELETFMDTHKLNLTDALKALILSGKNISKPQVEPDSYHAEVSEEGDTAKCPIGKNKGLWVRQSACRKCEETQCDIKR